MNKTTEWWEKVIEDLLMLTPQQYRESIKQKIKSMNDMFFSNRSPRFAIIGRRGAGKSSLINAVFGKPITKVGAVLSETMFGTWYKCSDVDRGAIEILDTRGLGDAKNGKPEDSMQVLRKSVKDKCPDAIIFLIKASEVDSRLQEDLNQLKEILKFCKIEYSYDIPVLCVVNKVDELMPIEVPLEDAEKQENITIALKHLESQFNLLNISTIKFLPICTYMRFDQNGVVLTDRRWQVNILVDYLFEILPKEAQFEFARISQQKEVLAKMARIIGTVACTTTAAVASVPLPIADLPVIAGIQIAMITAIASLSGREISQQTVLEFIGGVGASFGIGMALREAARAIIKFLIPGGGSVISASIAYAGTYALQEAAIGYYIYGKSIDEAKKMYQNSKEEKEKS